MAKIVVDLKFFDVLALYQAFLTEIDAVLIKNQKILFETAQLEGFELNKDVKYGQIIFTLSPVDNKKEVVRFSKSYDDKIIFITDLPFDLVTQENEKAVVNKEVEEKVVRLYNQIIRSFQVLSIKFCMGDCTDEKIDELNKSNNDKTDEEKITNNENKE